MDSLHTLLMGNKNCCSRSGTYSPTNQPDQREDNPYIPNRIDGLPPSLPVLQRDLQTAQDWLDENNSEAKQLLHPTHKPPDICQPIIEDEETEDPVKEEENRLNRLRKLAVDKLEHLCEELRTQSRDTERLLCESHHWLDDNNYDETTLDLQVARLEFSWTEYREFLLKLTRELNTPHLVSYLHTPAFPQSKHKHSTNQNPPNNQPANQSDHSSQSTPSDKVRIRKPTDQNKDKRKFVPHLTWQYRAVIKSNVKYRSRSWRGSAAPSEVNSVISEPGFSATSPRFRRDKSASTQSLNSLSSLESPLLQSVPVARSASTRSLEFYRVERPKAERSLAYKPEQLSPDDTLELDHTSNSLIVNSFKNRRPVKKPAYQPELTPKTKRGIPDGQTISLVKCGSVDSAELKEISVDFIKTRKTQRHTDMNDNLGAEEYEKNLTRSSAVHENLTTLQQLQTPPHDRLTPLRASHKITVVTPGAEFNPPNVSTPATGLVTRPAERPDRGAAGLPDSLIKHLPHTPIEIRKFLGTNNSALHGRLSPDDGHTLSDNSSELSSLTQSPTDQSYRSARKELKKQYKKDELWQAIRQDYHYLMDEDIIDQCKSTDSDLSWDDEHTAETAVSFTDFIKQYNELMEWLNQIQMFTQRQGSSLSERYLNQSYYEEMLDRSPRRKLFNDYAKRLMRRFPNMKDEITVRVQHLNNQWQSLQKSVAPEDVMCDRQTMIRDLGLDLRGLETWVNNIEKNLLPISLSRDLSYQQLKDMLIKHQVVQQDIECHSKIVSAVLKLCERLNSENSHPADTGASTQELQMTALNLERRWHSIWLQSLEWQCRLEEAISSRERLLGRSFHPGSGEADWTDNSILDQSELSPAEDNQSETSNAQTVTHDRATSPGTSTLRRKHKPRDQISSQESHESREFQSVDPGLDYIELHDVPDLLLLPDPLSSSDESQPEYTAVRPKQGIVRHYSDSGQHQRTASSVDDLSGSDSLDTSLPLVDIRPDRKRRYSDSAHISLDYTPDQTSPSKIKTRSLDQLDNLRESILRTSLPGDDDDSCSADEFSDESQFDETENLLRSVAEQLETIQQQPNQQQQKLHYLPTREQLPYTHQQFDTLERTAVSEPRVYTGLYEDNDDEFFMYDDSSILSRSQPSRIQLTSSETALTSVIEEEDEQEMRSSTASSPRRRKLSNHSPGEKVFASPRVKRFLHLESFSNTISPAETPPSTPPTRRKHYCDNEALTSVQDRVSEGVVELSPNGGIVILDNANLTQDMDELSSEAVSVITSRIASDPDSANHKPHSQDKLVYSLDEYNSRLTIQLSPKSKTTENVSVQSDNYYDDYTDSSELSSTNSPASYNKFGTNNSLLKSSRYSAFEDLSALAASGTDSDENSNLLTNQLLESDSRRSLSPSDLPTTRNNIQSDLPREFTSYDYMLGMSHLNPDKTQKGSTDFGYVSGGTLSEKMDPSPRGPPTHSPTFKQLFTSSANARPEISVIIEKPEEPTFAAAKQTTRIISIRSSSNSTPAESDVELEPDTLSPVDLRSPSGTQSPSRAGPSKITISGTQPKTVRHRTVETRTDLKLHVQKLNITVNSPNEGVISESSHSPRLVHPELTVLSDSFNPAELISKPGFKITTNKYANQTNSESHLESQIIPPINRRTYAPKSLTFTTDSSTCSPLQISSVEGHSEPCERVFSVLQGQTVDFDHITHTHGSCNSNLDNVTIWETTPGLPAHWEIIIQDDHSERSIETDVCVSNDDWLTSRSRSSSDSYSTGMLTPSSRYMKMCSVNESDNEDKEFSETIVINPNSNSAYRTAHQFKPHPSKSRTPQTYTRVPSLRELAVSAVPSGTRITLADLHKLHQKRGEILIKTNSTYQNQEYTHIHLSRHFSQPHDEEEALPYQPHTDTYTAEASLNFSSLKLLPCTADKPETASVGGEVKPPDVKRLVLSKRVLKQGRPNNVPLVMTATSTIHRTTSEDDLTQLSPVGGKKRRVVYTILDSGEVVFGDATNHTNDDLDVTLTQDDLTDSTNQTSDPYDLYNQTASLDELTNQISAEDLLDTLEAEQKALHELDTLLDDADDSTSQSTDDISFSNHSSPLRTDTSTLTEQQKRILEELDSSTPSTDTACTLYDLITGIIPPDEVNRISPSNLPQSPAHHITGEEAYTPDEEAEAPDQGAESTDEEAEAPEEGAESTDEGAESTDEEIGSLNERWGLTPADSYESGLTEDSDVFLPIEGDQRGAGSEYDTDELLRTQDNLDLTLQSSTNDSQLQTLEPAELPDIKQPHDLTLKNKFPYTPNDYSVSVADNDLHTTQPIDSLNIQTLPELTHNEEGMSTSLTHAVLAADTTAPVVPIISLAAPESTQHSEDDFTLPQQHRFTPLENCMSIQSVDVEKPPTSSQHVGDSVSLSVHDSITSVNDVIHLQPVELRKFSESSEEEGNLETAERHIDIHALVTARLDKQELESATEDPATAIHEPVMVRPRDNKTGDRADLEELAGFNELNNSDVVETFTDLQIVLVEQEVVPSEREHVENPTSNDDRDSGLDSVIETLETDPSEVTSTSDVGSVDQPQISMSSESRTFSPDFTQQTTLSSDDDLSDTLHSAAQLGVVIKHTTQQSELEQINSQTAVISNILPRESVTPTDRIEYQPELVCRDIDQYIMQSSELTITQPLEHNTEYPADDVLSTNSVSECIPLMAPVEVEHQNLDQIEILHSVCVEQASREIHPFVPTALAVVQDAHFQEVEIINIPAGAGSPLQPNNIGFLSRNPTDTNLDNNTTQNRPAVPSEIDDDSATTHGADESSERSSQMPLSSLDQLASTSTGADSDEQSVVSDNLSLNEGEGPTFLEVTDPNFISNRNLSAPDESDLPSAISGTDQPNVDNQQRTSPIRGAHPPRATEDIEQSQSSHQTEPNERNISDSNSMAASAGQPSLTGKSQNPTQQSKFSSVQSCRNDRLADSYIEAISLINPVPIQSVRPTEVSIEHESSVIILPITTHIIESDDEILSNSVDQSNNDDQHNWAEPNESTNQMTYQSPTVQTLTPVEHSANIEQTTPIHHTAISVNQETSEIDNLHRDYLLKLGTPYETVELPPEAVSILNNLQLVEHEGKNKLEKSASGISLGRSEADSDGVYGDESSEGENEQLNVPDLELSSNKLSEFLDDTLTESRNTRETSVETLRKLTSSDRASSPDHITANKSTPKRRRKRRPKSSVSASSQPEQHDQELTNQTSDNESHDPSATNQMSVTESDGTDAAALTSDGPKWDYYQEPLLGLEGGDDLSDVDSKMTDSVLMWDDELDNQNAILYDPNTTNRVAGSSVCGGADDESEDSDIEDLHDVIEQSSKQLIQAESALLKPRRDVAHCGVYLDPQKYTEWHATCQTHIRCLTQTAKAIEEHLNLDTAETSLPNLTEQDIQQLDHLIDKWTQLEQLSLTRYDQSSTLSKLYRELCAIKKTLDMCNEQQKRSEFNDVGELESQYTSLQTLRVTVQSQPYRIQQIHDQILLFESENPQIKMSTFKRMVDELKTNVRPTALNIGRKTTDVHTVIQTWSDWNVKYTKLEQDLTTTSYDITHAQLVPLDNMCGELEAEFSSFSSFMSEEARYDAQMRLEALRKQIQRLRIPAEPVSTTKPQEQTEQPTDTCPTQTRVALPHSDIDEPVSQVSETNVLSVNTDSGIGTGDHTSPESQRQYVTPDTQVKEKGDSDDIVVKKKVMDKEAIKASKKERKNKKRGKKGKRTHSESTDVRVETEPVEEPQSPPITGTVDDETTTTKHTVQIETQTDVISTNNQSVNSDPIQNTEQSTNTEPGQDIQQQTDRIPTPDTLTEPSRHAELQPDISTGPSRHDHLHDAPTYPLNVPLTLPAQTELKHEQESPTPVTGPSLKHGSETERDPVDEDVDLDVTPTTFPPIDEEVVDKAEPPVEVSVKRRQKVKPESAADVTSKADETELEDEVQPYKRTGWCRSALTRTTPFVILALLFLFMLFFLLQPRCCENSEYHRGVFGLRKKMDNVPPH